MRELLKKAALSMLLLGLMAVLLWQNGAVGQAVRHFGGIGRIGWVR